MSSKPWYQSRTIWTTFGSAIAAILGVNGLEIPADNQGEIVAGIMAVVNVVMRFLTSVPITK